MKKKVCLFFEHFTSSNGVCRSALAISGVLSKNYDVTLMPLFRFDSSFQEMLPDGVHVLKVFGFYFRGFAKILDLIPDQFLYKLIFKKHNFDLEIGFQKDMPIKIIAAGTSKTRKLAWMHGYDEGLLLRKQYQSIGEVICVSKCNAIRLKNELPSVTVDYCYNPIDDKKVVDLGKEDVDIPIGNRPLFITVGRHSQEKGYSRLLDIVNRLRNEGFLFSLWMIGEGPEYENNKQHSNKLQLESVVTFLGNKINPHKYTSKADVFVCSSFSEGYSTACSESIMLGVPVITTKVSGAEEIINESQAGILCDLDDDSLYLAIKYVLENPSDITKWKNTISNTKYLFSQDTRANKLIKIIEDILAK